MVEEIGVFSLFYFFRQEVRSCINGLPLPACSLYSQFTEAIQPGLPAGLALVSEHFWHRLLAG